MQTFKGTSLNRSIRQATAVFALSVACASFGEADSCIVSGSTVSVPIAERCAVGGLDSGGVSVCTTAGALEARFCTWLWSDGIGIDPTLMPGFFYIIR